MVLGAAAIGVDVLGALAICLTLFLRVFHGLCFLRGLDVCHL